MRFAKYHGTGNDFVLIEDLADRLALSEGLVASICDRHLGVGADGIIRIAPSDRADFFMDYWNAEGDVAEMCGNGIRCLAKYVHDRGHTAKTEIDVDSRDGVKRLALTVENGEVRSVRVDMGVPALERAQIPIAGPPGERFVGRPFPYGGREYRGTAVSMGNPHLVLLGATDLFTLDLSRVGPDLEHHPDFPQRTNVEFIRVEVDGIHARVWERGVGETMACGTGACATVVAANLQGLVGRQSTVHFPGGELRVEWGDDDHVYLDGPAIHVFDGELEQSWVEALSAEARR